MRMQLFGLNVHSKTLSNLIHIELVTIHTELFGDEDDRHDKG